MRFVHFSDHSISMGQKIKSLQILIKLEICCQSNNSNVTCHNVVATSTLFVTATILMLLYIPFNKAMMVKDKEPSSSHISADAGKWCQFKLLCRQTQLYDQ